MSDGQLKYSTKFFVANPQGAYDPAPLHEFDLEEQDSPPAIVAGDVICANSRIGNQPMRAIYYKVVDRTFRFDTDEIRVFVMVQEIDENWTSQFN